MTIRLFARLACRQPAPARAEHAAAAAPADADDERAGCGWFDSSHALRCGLVIREHDTPPAELPLAQWLELTLAGLAPRAA